MTLPSRSKEVELPSIPPAFSHGNAMGDSASQPATQTPGPSKAGSSRSPKRTRKPPPNAAATTEKPATEFPPPAFRLSEGHARAVYEPEQLEQRSTAAISESDFAGRTQLVNLNNERAMSLADPRHALLARSQGDYFYLQAYVGNVLSRELATLPHEFDQLQKLIPAMELANKLGAMLVQLEKVTNAHRREEALRQASATRAGGLADAG